MTPALDNCPMCQWSLQTFYRMKSLEIVAFCPNPRCEGWHVEGTGDKTEDAKAMFHGECLKRGLMGKRANA